MIRINLLAVDRPPPGRRFRFDLRLGDSTTLLSGLILLVAVGLIGLQFFAVRAESRALDDELTAARQEYQRLQELSERVQQFQDRREQLQLRVVLIENLRRDQVGPVQMLDQVSQNLPDSLWLTELRQEGNALVILGRAMTLTALSDFVANLELSGYFIPPVDLIDSQLEDQAEGQVVRFRGEGPVLGPGGCPGVVRSTDASTQVEDRDYRLYF